MLNVQKYLKRLLYAAAALATFAAVTLAALISLDRAFPPPIPEQIAVSREVVDRDGALLRTYATQDGIWRLGVSLDQVDPAFVKMLVIYEDKRFWDHAGVDLLALARAAGQFAANGRIVSGGSTLSMQLARLTEPREERSLGSKLRQIFRAWQIERRLSKREILERYLTLAPYGGNLEGIRAASLAYFGKEPKRLTVSQSALLVALPQLPERRRPDRFRDAAETARDRVLTRMVDAGLLAEREAQRVSAEEVSEYRFPLPALAAHLADSAARAAPTSVRHTLTIQKSVQTALEAVARTAARRLGDRVSVAMVLADARTGEILGLVGSSDYFDAARSGWIDMTRASRSPGSTLKPFIYGLAFEQGLVAQETLIEDRPADFAGYRPRNFDLGYQGDVTVRQALQMSLNVPAVRLLDAVGPARLTARFRRADVTPSLPPGESRGLAIGLGGVGLTLRDLVQLYTSLANGGRAMRLRDGTETAFEPLPDGMIFEPQASWQVTDILAGVRPPENASPRAIAYKTGTSYGYRDAWSVGYDGGYVLGAWVGRADSGSVPGLAGYTSAAPILFEAFARSGLPVVPRQPAPAGASRQAPQDLPVTLKRFGTPDSGRILSASAGSAGPTVTEPAPRIVFPPDGAHVDLNASSGGNPLVLKLQGGRAPFRWLANGKPLAGAVRRPTATWQPDGAGYSTLTVIDAAGRAASVKVFVE
ncbi:penicillin-binding protein 1C [Pseudaminobacter sp. 19-2017]|uniref:peptidoglycan glycosyltransferase n=1 Tax=Pseudaminobacter soli (ex Zhang et al. 2022) TaxID=2831468 RepID=A0A942DXX4_9HYPH|nr:penicillin-binding protein 1C [Pseudaminobacter soli]MBS3649117.1 penicillin-binding protein 1C [Pseudaminobacter soli]